MANGKIRNQKGFRQKVTFKTLGLGNGIFPTDIDGMFEIQNKLWIIFEIKHKLAPITIGQKLLLERTTDALNSIDDKSAYAFVIDHEINVDKDIEAGECLVRQFRYNGVWKRPEKPVKFKDAVNKIYEKHIK